MHRRFACLAAGLTLAIALAACGSDDSASPTTTPANTATTSAATGVSAAPSAPAGDGAFPMTVQVCGRDWHFDEPPQRIVTTDTPMLDLAIMLGVQDRVVGYFGSVDHLDPSVQAAAAGLQRLGDNWPYPTLEAVLAGDPDLVLSYGYNAEAGFTADRLQEEGIANFTVTEGCDDFDGTSTVETYYDDVRTLATILGVGDRAEALIHGWEARVDAVRAAAPAGEPIRVLNTGSGDPASPFVSAARAVGHDLIEIAGGTDVFGDTDAAYLSPTWEEVVARDPQLIIESSGFGEQGLEDVKAHLRSNPALATMSAVVDDHFTWITYEQGVPGPQMFTGLETISAAIIAAS
ncbi:MAG: ABC transporter substrate-binding protein [Ilumatobacteraceae bacterium]